MSPRYLPLPLLVAIVLAVSACGTTVAEGASSNLSDDAAVSTERADPGSVFDAGVVHEIAIEIDDTDVADMIATYLSDDEKEWIEATVTIDGSTYDSVGLRLKGNSSLRGVSTDSLPEGLPWLIRLDKYVDDQNHEGYTDLVVRSNTTATALNEAVALELLGDAGLATEQAISVSFSANGSAPVLRLVVEHPDDTWMAATFAGEGALYKAESTGDWSYRGDDPESYDDVFDQEAGKDDTDLTPLIDFLDFINNADDATFAAELPERLDVEAFARYLAMMDLVDNFDDIDGPGNNAYLYYDIETEQFTVVPWDLNLAFGATNEGVGGRPVGEQPTAGPTAPEGAAGGRLPGGQQQSNVLVERFKANDSFLALYTAALTDLDAQLFDSGAAEAVLADWMALLETVPQLIDPDAVAADAATISQVFP